MTHATPRSLRRATIAVMVAALLSAAAFMAVSAEKASATYGVCGAGDFSLHYIYGQSGGVYHFSGSDSNLDNDHYEGGASNLTRQRGVRPQQRQGEQQRPRRRHRLHGAKLDGPRWLHPAWAEGEPRRWAGQQRALLSLGDPGHLQPLPDGARPASALASRGALV